MDIRGFANHRDRKPFVGSVFGDLQAAAILERHDHRERAAQRRPGVRGRVAKPDPSPASEVDDQVQRREREIDELASAHAAVEREALERRYRRLERLEHRH